MRGLGLVTALWACAACSDGGSGSAATDGAMDAAADASAEAGVDAAADVASDARSFAASDKRLLSDQNPDHKDEDPSVILANDGSLLVAYFSERSANPDIFVKRTTDGESWTETRVTLDPGGDFYANLHQDASGVVHLTWFRWTAFEVGSIWHNSSPNGIDWDPANETRVTVTPNVDDWVPTLSSTGAGDLVIVFASKKRNPSALSELYVSRLPAGSATWTDPVAPFALNDPARHDTLPFITHTGNEITLFYVRTDATSSVPWLNPSADIFVSSSPDALGWSAPLRVTNDDPQSFVDVFPGTYADHAGNWSLIWTSGKTGGGDAYVMPLSELSGFPSSAKVQPIFEGYSPRVARTPTPGVFIGVWVEADPVDDQKKDVYYRFFEQE